MTDMARDQPIRIVPYDASWPARFEDEKRVLLAVVGDVAVGGVHHVGSTSVPGLAAKPTIDILVGVASLHAARPYFADLADLEYNYAPYRPSEMHWFCKPSPAVRTFHLHLVAHDSERYVQELEFRDILCGNPEAAGRYEALKLRLADTFGHDREGYTDAKASFIANVLANVHS